MFKLYMVLAYTYFKPYIIKIFRGFSLYIYIYMYVCMYVCMYI